MQIFSSVRYLVDFDDSPALLTIDFCGNSLFTTLPRYFLYHDIQFGAETFDRKNYLEVTMRNSLVEKMRENVIEKHFFFNKHEVPLYLYCSII